MNFSLFDYDFVFFNVSGFEATETQFKH